jgi:SAM-dependent methyltransferase
MNLAETSSMSAVLKEQANVQGCPACGRLDSTPLMGYPAKSSLFQNRRVVQCPDCRLTYADPMPDDQALTRYYRSGTFWGHVAETTPFAIPTYHHQAQARLAFIQKHCTLPSAPRVLDIGAGYGVFEETFRKAYPGVELFAIEPDPKAQLSLKESGVRTADDLTAFQGTTFDLIILSHVLEHINRPIPYLRSLHTFCHNGTTLFIEIPHEDHLFKRNLEPHVLFFSPESLSSALKKAGFETSALATCGLRREEQRLRNQKAQRKQRFQALLPLREHLKRLKHRWTGAPVPIPAGSSSLAADSFECAIYGPDRIWIRALAMRVIP